MAFHSDATNLVSGDTNIYCDVFVHDRQSGVTKRVSVDSAGSEGDEESRFPSISGDGRHVAFESYATNLVSGDTNSDFDAFVHDRQTGITERVDVSSAGGQADGFSDWSSISADRAVAFYSSATNLVSGDTNSDFDAFVHDRQTGITERVSVDSAGREGDGQTRYPSISGDGQYVTFQSYATNLVAGETERVSVDSAGGQGNSYSDIPSISADGRYVAFESSASNLIFGDTNGWCDVFVHDRQTGITDRVSVDSTGGEGDSHSWYPSISGDGRDARGVLLPRPPISCSAIPTPTPTSSSATGRRESQHGKASTRAGARATMTVGFLRSPKTGGVCGVRVLFQQPGLR